MNKLISLLPLRLLTDGISFLAEYQIMDKPLVFLDSKVHERFTELGERVAQGTYNVSSPHREATLQSHV
jgi:hypothetical protein